MKPALLLFASLLALSTSLEGCNKAHAAASEAAPAHEASGTPVAWETLKTEDESFSIPFPGKPIVQFRQNTEGKQILCGLDLPEDVHYSVIMNQINEKEAGPPPKTRLKGLLSRAASYYGAGAKVESRKENLKVDGNPAVEYQLSFTNQGKKLKLRCRAFFAHDCHQMFQVMAAGPQGAPDAQRFLDGFKLGRYTAGKEESSPTPTPKPSASEGHE